MLPPPLERRRKAIVLVHGAWAGEWSWTPLIPLLEECFNAGGVHLIEVPVDYSDNDRILNSEIREQSQRI